MRTLGRINRTTYWLAVAVTVVVAIAVQFVTRTPFQGANFMLLVVAVPRLHDIGRAGWWALVVLVLEFAAGMAIGKFLPPAQMMTGIGAIAVLVLALTILVGSVRGDAGPNRFGAQPADGISYSADRPAA